MVLLAPPAGPPVAGPPITSRGASPDRRTLPEGLHTLNLQVRRARSLSATTSHDTVLVVVTPSERRSTGWTLPGRHSIRQSCLLAAHRLLNAPGTASVNLNRLARHQHQTAAGRHRLLRPDVTHASPHQQWVRMCAWRRRSGVDAGSGAGSDECVPCILGEPNMRVTSLIHSLTHMHSRTLD